VGLLSVSERQLLRPLALLPAKLQLRRREGSVRPCAIELDAWCETVHASQEDREGVMILRFGFCPDEAIKSYIEHVQ
jgi:hypothetical protein